MAEQETGPVAQAGRPAAWGRVYLGLYAAYVIGGFALRWNGWIHFDQIWFVDAARHILDGSWQIYAFRPADPAVIGIAPPLGLAYSYSPLPALLMAPFVALADALGGTGLAAGVGGVDPLAYRLIIIPLLLADVLAMEQLRALVRAWRPQVDETALFLGILPTLFVTGFLEVSAHRDHQEGLVLLCLLLTLRWTPRHLWLGGVLAGLTLAAKQTAVLELLPIGLVLLLAAPGTAWTARLRRGAAWGGIAGAVFGVILLPAVLADPGAFWYAFVTQEQRRVLSGPGLPTWIDSGLQALAGPGSPAYASGHAALVAGSNAALVLIAGGLMLGVILWQRARGQALGLIDSRLLALVALGGLLQIVLAKWVTGHYYQLPLALVLLWDTVRRAPRWPLLGYAGTLGFRAITVAVVLPAVPQVKDGLLLALYAALSVAALAGAAGPPDGAAVPARPAAVTARRPAEA